MHEQSSDSKMWKVDRKGVEPIALAILKHEKKHEKNTETLNQQSLVRTLHVSLSTTAV